MLKEYTIVLNRQRMSDRKSECDPMEGQLKEIMSYLEKLGKDEQTVAMVELEKAMQGAPMMARPLWLRGVPRDTIVQARQKIQEAFAVRFKSEPKKAAGGSLN
jgi:hypothetical protein